MLCNTKKMNKRYGINMYKKYKTFSKIMCILKKYVHSLVKVFVHPYPTIYSSSDFPYVWSQKYLTHTIYFLYEYIVRPGRSGDKGLSSLPASLYKRKFKEFSMNGGPGFNKKNSPHLCDEFPYSAIQLPAAISIWESSGFLSSVAGMLNCP